VRRAIVSDIHGNLEAFSRVLEDIASQSVDAIICLGDVLGYGPNPIECLDLVMRRCQLTILGNHDQAAVFDPDGFNPMALRAIYWTRDQLDNTELSRQADINRRWDFLTERPRSAHDGDYLFVHGSPRDPTNEYVFPETAFDKTKIDSLFARVGKYCFQGHTHMPGVFTTEYDFVEPADCQHEYPLENQKLMINVGSVGQPRDDDPRACYAIVDDSRGRLEFRRVAYDLDQTIKKIYAVPQLDNQLGDRLRSGR